MEVIDSDKKKAYIGTTDSQEEWMGLLQEVKLAKTPFVIVEDLGLSGMNKYERDAAIEKMIKMIKDSKSTARR